MHKNNTKNSILASNIAPVWKNNYFTLRRRELLIRTMAWRQMIKIQLTLREKNIIWFGVPYIPFEVSCPVPTSDAVSNTNAWCRSVVKLL